MSQTKAQLIAGTSSQDVTFDDATVNSLNGGPLAGSRNRIINGDMRIDQRNNGASVANAATFAYTLDRWQYGASQASKFTIQRNAGSVTPPVGFSHWAGITSTSAYTPVSSDYFGFLQNIEGFNTSDFAFGTASARAISLSFWVRSSLTGDFGAHLNNSGSTRSYYFRYNIPIANTWTYITKTITGDTTGTWLSDNSTGLALWFDLGSGSSQQSSTVDSWTATGVSAPTSCVNVLGTNGATFYITGVQLEPGTVSTPFERRSYAHEVLLCQRYFQQLGGGMVGFEEGNTTQSYGLRFMQPMRATPTFSLISSSFVYRYINASSVGDRTITVSINGATTISTQAAWLYFNDVSTGSVLGRGAIERNGSNYINASAEL